MNQLSASGMAVTLACRDRDVAHLTYDDHALDQIYWDPRGWRN